MVEENSFFKGWLVGRRLRGRRGNPQGYGAAAAADGAVYDKVSFLSGLAAGLASRGAPLWAFTGEKIRADHEYALPVGSGIPADVEAEAKTEYALPVGPGIAGTIEVSAVAEYALPVGPAIEVEDVYIGASADYALPVGEPVETEVGEG